MDKFSSLMYGMFDFRSITIWHVFGIVLTAYVIKCVLKLFCPYKLAPGPRSWPVIGALPEIIRNQHRILDYLEECKARYGNTVGIEALDHYTVVIFEPKCIKHMLTDNFNNYDRFAKYSRVKQFFGNGIFRSSGKLWKSQRKTIRPMFRVASIKTMMPIMKQNAQGVIGQIARAGYIDVQQIFMVYTLVSFLELGFGIKSKSRSFGKIAKKFAKHFDYCQSKLEANFHNPLVRMMPDKQFDASIKWIDSFVYNIIKGRRATGPGDDLLSAFMKSVPESKIGEKFLRDIMVNFMIAGRDTTAILLTWTTYMLGKHPRVLKKLRARVADVNIDDYASVSKVKYLQYVLDETLRLYPPVPTDLRVAKEADVLPNGYAVPAGTIVAYSSYITHRMPEYWDDPLRFWPERWENATAREPYSFIPFHGGPQLCVGREMAYVEAKILIILLVQKFDIKLDPNHIVEPRKSIVMPARNGVRIRAIPA